MSCYEEVLNTYLETFSLLYVQIGKIELTLRSVIPKALRNKPGEKRTLWFSPLSFNKENRLKIERAINYAQHDFDSIPKHLPLSFWTKLFNANNYESLWLPYLHRCFPNLKNAKSKRSSKEIHLLMKELVRIRNFVAHYNFSTFEDFARDREHLQRLHFLLGL